MSFAKHHSGNHFNGNEGIIRGEFYYRAEDDRVEKCCPFEYEDSYFFHSTTKPNYDLLRFSLKLAMSASRKEDILYFYDKVGYSYTSNINYDKEKRNKLAGDRVTDSVYYPAQIIDGVAYINSIAYAIGSKKVEDKTIILVTIRGGDYGIEWGGNFNLGTGVDHEGFRIASDQVIEGIRNFIRNIDGPVRLHLTGYSRAAAVSNMTAARLDQGEVEGLSRDNVSCYTFEAPRNTRSEDAFEEKYDNIFNIVNPSDLIPKIFFSAWGYRRYGQEINIPAYQTDKYFLDKFKNMQSLMKERLKTIYDLSIDDTYIIDKFSDNLAFIMESPEVYVERYQKIIERSFMNFDSGIHLNHEEKKVFKDLIRKLYLLDSVNTKDIKPLISNQSGYLGFNFNSPLLSNHKMGTELSWIESLKSLSNFGPGDYLLAEFNNIDSIEIKNKGMDLVHIINENSEKLSKELWNQINVNDQKVIILDEDRSYELDFKKIESKLSSYSLYKFNQKKGRLTSAALFTLNQAHYFNNLSGTITKNIEKTLIYQDKKKVEPLKLFIEDLPRYSVRIHLKGNGECSGGGYFYPGQTCRVKVESNQSEFLGWFNSDECLSRDHIYYLNPDHDIILEAKFKEK